MKVKNEVIALLDRAKETQNPKKTYREANKLIDYLIKEVDSEWKFCNIYSITIEDEPCGSLQNDDEYVDQITGYLGDDYSGTYYYPIENSDKYLAIQYEC